MRFWKNLSPPERAFVQFQHRNESWKSFIFFSSSVLVVWVLLVLSAGLFTSLPRLKPDIFRAETSSSLCYHNSCSLCCRDVLTFLSLLVVNQSGFYVLPSAQTLRWWWWGRKQWFQLCFCLNEGHCVFFFLLFFVLAGWGSSQISKLAAILLPDSSLCCRSLEYLRGEDGGREGGVGWGRFGGFGGVGGFSGSGIARNVAAGRRSVLVWLLVKDASPSFCGTVFTLVSVEKKLLSCYSADLKRSEATSGPLELSSFIQLLYLSSNSQCMMMQTVCELKDDCAVNCACRVCNGAE